MAKQCIIVNSGAANHLTQNASANSIKFSETNYWEDGAGNIKSGYAEIKYKNGNRLGWDLTEKEIPPAENHYAAYAAYQYGDLFEVETGRLLTYSEAEDLLPANDAANKAEIKAMLFGDSTNGYLNYWLGAAHYYSGGVVWCVDGYYGNDGNDSNGAYYSGFDNANDYGVRPVIEISKDKIS